MTSTVGGLVVATAIGAALAGVQVGLPTAAPQAQAQPAPQDRPNFRSGVDVVPVDVQVVDAGGQPVTGLTAADFEVTINGRRRRVVSVDFIDSRSTNEQVAAAEARALAPPSSAAPALPRSPAQRRIYVLAVDAASFEQSTARPVLIAASAFVKQLQPQDEIGLYAYPIGPKIEPTTDHDAVARAIETITAVRETAPPGQFYLTPSNVVELSRTPRTQLALDLIEIFCPPTADPGCQLRLEAQVTGEVLFYEGVAYSGMATLRALMVALGAVAERKTVVLISGGIVASDLIGGRPDVGALASDLGRVAAQSNVNVYTLFIDQLWLRQMSAESGRPPVEPNRARESLLSGRMLDELSDTSGGTLLQVPAGNGTLAFDRVLRETSAHYLLGVEPLPEDRAGRPRQLRIRVRDRNLSVRGRSWIGMPQPSPTPAVAAASPAKEVPVAPPPVASLPPATPAIQRLATAFDRDDRFAIAEALAPSNASGLLRSFRENSSPWPASPRRTAAFALDLAITGARAESIYTREEALRLLAEYVVRVRQPGVNDSFECAWLWAASAGAAGLFAPEVGAIVTERAVERCPGDGNLHLARAVAQDQQLLLIQRQLAPPSEHAAEATVLERRVLDLYDSAAAFPTVRFEARLRAAHVLFRANRHDEGLATLNAAGDVPDDAHLRFYGHLIRGQLLQSLERLDEAAVAFRAAADAWPGAQSARIALMNLLISRQQTADASALAESVLVAPATTSDPWWIYYLGDYRAYPGLVAQVKGLAP